ncbi:MAG: SPASM domain-containing protein [Armatimonadetes bacterium]|nr:SPASM domain-containing protein [Armatimonadota bacterium]
MMAIDCDRILNKIAFIREQVTAIKTLLAEKSREEILSDPWLVKGLKYSLQTAVEAMIDIARDLGVDALNYQHQWSLTPKMLDAHNRKHGAEHYIPCNTGQIDLPKPNVEAIVEVVSRIRRRARADSSKMYIHFHPELDDKDVRLWYENPHTWVKRRTPACAWITADILPNGDVEACTGLVCGNVTTEKFGDIWNNETYRKHRQRLIVHGGLPICSR